MKETQRRDSIASQSSSSSAHHATVPNEKRQKLDKEESTEKKRQNFDIIKSMMAKLIDAQSEWMKRDVEVRDKEIELQRQRMESIDRQVQLLHDLLKREC